MSTQDETPATSSAPATSPDSNPKRVLLAIITEGRSEMNLQCCTSILHTQIDLMTTQNSFMAELEFVPTLNDALDILHKNKSLEGVFAIRYNAGVPGSFAPKAFSSGESVVIAPSPRPGVDWTKVRDYASSGKENKEPLNHAGNTYNVKLEGLPRADGYTSVKDVDWVDAIFMRRNVVDTIAEKYPDIVSEEKSAFTLDGVYDGKFFHGTKRLFHMYDGPIWADVERQCVISGPLEFVGCVGHRSVLR